MWTLVQTPAEAKDSILGPDVVGLSMLLGSLLAAVILLHQLAMLLVSAPAPGAVRRCVALLLVLVWLMTGTLQRINQAFRPAASAPQARCLDRLPQLT